MPALRELETAGSLEVVALLDPVARHAALLREAFPQAQAVSELSGLSQHAFDLAIVASPHSLHAAQSIHLLEAGVSVLCEKPMATSADDASAMARAAAASRGLLAIGLVRRFFPAAQAIRSMLSQRMLGDISSFEFSEGSATFGWPAASRGYFDKHEAQGGVLMDIGVHALDLLQWWLGKPAIVDFADDAMGGIEANCLIRCRLEAGATGALRLSRDCALANRYTIQGTNGWLSWEAGDAGHFDFGLADTSQVIHSSLNDQAASSFEQSFLCQPLNVVAALRGTEDLRVPAAEGVAGIELIDTCYRGRSLMAMPWLHEREIARGRELNGGMTLGSWNGERSPPLSVRAVLLAAASSRCSISAASPR